MKKKHKKEAMDVRRRRVAAQTASDPVLSPAPEASSFLSVLLANTAKRSLGGITQDSFRAVPQPVRRNSIGAFAPAVARLWQWFRKNQRLTAKKQLRVSDTVGLGEKRFVALLHFEGRKFLIGGGASSVSLLTELGDVATGSVMQPIAIPGSAE